jgi:hypothetical protein
MKHEALIKRLKVSCLGLDAVDPLRLLVNDVVVALREPEQEPVAVYGYCPECGEKGVQRERRPNGNDKCANGHTYPSSKAAQPAPVQEPDYWLGYGLQAHTEKPFENATALYKDPPQRTWVGLTDEDIVDALQPLYQTRALAELAAELFMDEFQAVVCKFMEKNT